MKTWQEHIDIAEEILDVARGSELPEQASACCHIVAKHIDIAQMLYAEERRSTAPGPPPRPRGGAR
jgi:hypothetical protein